ncbi:helix-turn-helix transcriptional regulator [Collinsella tanakaei]|uniref:helix-turn-helix transcriptional regulator n=1 Tax=Collinsella tanakaei TaxID=626935 RepID=UPI0025A37BD3|nr:AraC family transcriptional regulator [Collinsella tanakaei]MDM8300182.1 AraC family transcriptional regulator [Collinsella tanakaei]
MQDGQLHYRYENANANLRLEHYVYRIGSYHYNWHADFELLVVVKGSVELCASGARYVLDEDDMILINPNEGHATLGLGQDNTAMVLHIDPAFFRGYFGTDEMVSLRLVSDPARRSDPRLATIRRCLAQMMVLSARSDPASRLHYDASFYRLMSAIVPEGSGREDADTFRIDHGGNDVVNKLVAYIERNYRRRVTLADLARKTGYNTSYISQLFKDKLGINFSDYLTRVRLAAATAALSSSDARVSDIAAEYGFADLKAFNAAFKKTFGKSPTEYRGLLSADNRATDTVFKQVFVSADDEYVGMKLAGYIAGRSDGDAAAVARKTTPFDDKALDDLRRSLEEMRSSLEQATAIAAELTTH